MGTGAIELILKDLDATETFAARLAPLARAGDVIALAVDLGAGKTTFARAFVGALATRYGLPPEEVPSPTFTLVQTYDFPPFTLYHIDLYRLARAEEALELGIEDAFADGVSLIEWPDRLGRYLPAERLALIFLPGAGPESRTLRIEPHGAWAGRLRQLRQEGLHG
jgi:tRNA threonylcarbamoyladenosine biosynthesis protein TsaE